jgi:predicted metal-dependent peptidase
MEARRLHTLSPELRQRFAAGRVWAAQQAPYLATALLALDPVVVLLEPHERVDLSAFPVDGRWHVYIDPAVLERVEVPEVGFWLLHQAGHLLRSHAVRFPERKLHERRDPGSGRTPAQRRWNAATDAEIDDDLSTDALQMPERAITPASLGLEADQTAETYWDELDDADQDADRPLAYDCGSGCDGQPREWDCGWPGLSAAAIRRCKRDTARRIRDHVRKRGDVPLGWQRWADEILDPTVDWRRELAAQIRRGAAEVAGRVDFTYRRPSRRQTSVPDVVLPSLRQPLPRVAVVIDTSGSMSDGMLAQALGEVGGVLRSVGVARRDLRVICCDAQAYEAQAVRELGRVELPGGGGTDMRRGIQAAADLRPAPNLIVVLTDGLTPWPSAPPERTQIVVGLMDETGSTPSWADVVLVGEAKR